MSSNYIKNIAIIGAGGQVGAPIIKALLEQGKHTVTAISRLDSTSTLPDGVSVKKVDYADHASLVEALKGQDALIIVLAVTADPSTQLNIIKAAAEAKVSWIVPNEYGGDYGNPKLAEATMIGARVLPNRALIEELGVSSWVALSCSYWYEYSLALPPAYGFDTVNREVVFFSGGEVKMPTSTFPQVGRAAAKLFALPIKSTPNHTGPVLEDYKNKSCFFKSFIVTQKDIFESVKRVTNTTDADWKISNEDAHDRFKAGLEELQGGRNRSAFVKVLYSRSLWPEDNEGFYGHLEFANEALGLPEEDIDEFTKLAVETQKGRAGQ